MLCIALYCPVLQIIDHFLGSSLKDEVRPPARLPASPFVALPACPPCLPPRPPARLPACLPALLKIPAHQQAWSPLLMLTAATVLFMPAALPCCHCR